MAISADIESAIACWGRKRTVFNG